jgi:pimeloyl-ACP methyl ester carboxylesterase
MSFLDIGNNSIVKVLDKTKPYIIKALSNSIYHVPFSKEELEIRIEEQIFGMVNEIKNYNPSDLKIPTLINAVRLDDFTPEQMSEELHKKIPNSRLEIIDMAGHFGPAQRDDVYNEVILEFIKNLK